MLAVYLFAVACPHALRRPVSASPLLKAILINVKTRDPGLDNDTPQLPHPDVVEVKLEPEV